MAPNRTASKAPIGFLARAGIQIFRGSEHSEAYVIRDSCMSPTTARGATRGDETGHAPVKGEERTIILNESHHRPRWWVVEVAHSWFKRFRKLLVRYEKTAASPLALLFIGLHGSRTTAGSQSSLFEDRLQLGLHFGEGEGFGEQDRIRVRHHEIQRRLVDPPRG